MNISQIKITNLAFYLLFILGQTSSTSVGAFPLEENLFSDKLGEKKVELSNSAFTFIPETTYVSGNLGDELIINVPLINISSNTLTAYVVREINDLPADWISALSIGEMIFAPYIDSIATTPGFQIPPIEPGDTLDFSIRFFPLTNGGIAHIRLRAGDLYNLVDTLSIDLYAEVVVLSGSIQVLIPNGGEIWEAGNIQQISWESSDVDSIKIEFSTDNGSQWGTIISSYPASSGIYSWLVPNIPSNQCRVKITSRAFPYTSDISDNPFSIIPMNIGADWFWQNPWPQANDLWGVSFVDENNGIAVGYGETILRTTDGGNSWDIQSSGTIATLWDVELVDQENGYIVGDNGTILHTTNGGESWISQLSGTSNSLHAVSFTDLKNGTIVGSGNIILHTDDGGENWVIQSGGVGLSLWDVFFTDINNGTAVGDMGKILRTTNGGQTWSIQQSGVGSRLYGVSFTSATTGTVVGSNGVMFRTTDGGENWLPQFVTGNSLYDVTFRDMNNGIIVGFEGTILKTSDGGENWFAKQSGTYWPLLAVSLCNINNGIAVGYSGVILSTSDGGESWISLSKIITTQWLRDVSFSDLYNGTAVGESGVIVRTTDAGENWLSQQSGTSNILCGVSFIDVNNGATVGFGGIILHTTDSGNSWISQLSGTTANLSATSFVDINNGIAVGDSGIILRTTNGGDSWYRQTSGTTNILRDISFIDLNTGTAVGGDGTIIRTIDGGQNWLSQLSGTTNTLSGVSFSDINNGTAVGASGTIVRTTDGGAHWIIQTSGTTNNFLGVSFTDPNNGFVVGGPSGFISGVILRTTDGGENWNMQFSGGYFLIGVSFANENYGWVVGADGIILHTTNGGASFFDDEQFNSGLTEYILWQNYPNPFNPSTTIKYSIPEMSKVRLIIFNLLGEEVITLVDEEKTAGNYTLEFNATRLPSGVYFYRIQAGDFVQTNKMILLK